ncbi:MAG: family 10 glycosylhydrolase, partial [Victivallaceae bacterium]
KKMGFNKVVIIMKHGPAYYPSKLKLDDINENEFYYGDCAVQEARKRGMKVAFVFSPFMNGPQDGKIYPYDVNKTEYDKIQQGKMKLSDVGASTKTWTIKNCPDHPDVRQRALDVTTELINKYHPDEMYLDYIRYKDGYETSCYCDYSQKQKAEFAAKHPEIKKDKLDDAFAEYSITAFVTEWAALCKKLDPKIKTSCYTMSTARDKTGASWVNNYPLDWHAKYVSRNATGPESSLEDTVALTKSYSKWIKSGAAETVLSPIVAAYNPKSGARLLTEFKIVSDLEDKANVKFKRVEFYEYSQLLEGPKKDLKINQDMASGISKALGGTFPAK